MNQPLELPPPAPQSPNLPKPDWVAIGQALGTLSRELPRMAHVNVQPQLDYIVNGMNMLIDHVNAMSQRIDIIQNNVQMTPLRLTNATTHSTTPLLYPPPFVAEPGGPFPYTRNDLECINGHDAAIALGHLGLPIPDAMDDRIYALQAYLSVKIRR